MTRFVRLRRAAFALTCLLGLLCIGAVYVTLDGVTDRLVEQDRQSIADRARLHDQVTDVEATNAALAEQVRALGAVPVVETDAAGASTLVPLRGPQGAPGVTGPRGRPGRPGVGTPGQVGSPGARGNDGQPGPAGKDGANGKDGQPGKDGRDGVDGRGIASMDCDAAANWQITYTDGATQTIAGPCRLGPPPPSTEPTE